MRAAVFPDDRQFWFETLRILGHAAYGGSDVGEVLTIAERITPGDYDSWYDAWRTAADRIKEQAATSMTGGHRVSARDGMLRAATYYGAAEFFLHGSPDDPRINDAYERGAACFAAAAALYTPQVSGEELTGGRGPGGVLAGGREPSAGSDCSRPPSRGEH